MVNKIKSRKDPYFDRERSNYATPVPSREYILQELAHFSGPVRRRQLLAHFGIKDPDLVEGLRRRLKAMVRDGQLLSTKRGYLAVTENTACEGKLTVTHPGDGYVETSTGDRVKVSGGLRGYYHGDTVAVTILQTDNEGALLGRIDKLVTAITPYVIGRLLCFKTHGELTPFDRKFNQNIRIPQGKQHQAATGSIVKVKILRDEPDQSPAEPVGEVVEVFGDFSKPGIEIEMAVSQFGLPTDFPTSVLKACESFSERQIAARGDRKDISHLPLVTIDGEDAKDFDDAVYCEKRLLGGYRLWVAIADVSFYVKPNSALDKEAATRSNSTYFPGHVIPMLPEALSNELCSLKPDVPRLCVVCQMTISSKGEIKRSVFYRAKMRSHARLTYSTVAEILAGNQTLAADYSQPVNTSLRALHAVYRAFHQARIRRGAIDFETTETRILFDGQGKIQSIIPTERTVAHKMIEECMLSANVCAAKFIQRHKRPALYRIHDKPPSEKLTALRQFLAELGLDLGGKDNPTPKHFAKLINKIQTRDDKHLIQTVLLRSLSQAQYHPDNIGHFGLAYPSYVHFTSPIRRYPDLLIHRTITDILAGKKTSTALDLEQIGLQCSENERRSDDATREATLALKCHYMQDKVGEEYQGVVAGVAAFGIFVELKDIYIEGLVHVTALGDEYFHYDATHHRMIGDRTRTTYRIGDLVAVRVVKVDLDTKRIDLELIKQTSSRVKPRRKKSKSRSKGKKCRTRR